MPSPYTTAQREAAFDAYYVMGRGRHLDKLIINLTGTEMFPDRPPALQTLKEWSRKGQEPPREPLSKDLVERVDRELREGGP